MMRQKFLLPKRALLLLVLAFGLGALVPPANASTTVCYADSSQICADISALTFTTNGVNSPITSGQASANLAATVFTFHFASSSGLGRKWLSVHFYDISPGMHLLPTIGDETLSHACSASSTIGKSCSIQTDANGAATFDVKILTAQVGKGFSYQMIGPAGFSSGAVSVMFSVTGANVRAAETCNADRSKVCGPITRVSFEQDSKPVSVIYADAGTGSAILATGTSELVFKYTSNADYAYKWAFMKFLNASSGVATVIDSGDPTLSTACSIQDAVGNGCTIRLDSTGSASFIVTIAGGAVGKTVKYEMAGPSFDSKTVTISFGAATVFAPVVVPASVATITGTTGLVKVVLTNAKAKTVKITLPGAPAATFKPVSNSETYYFPRAKASVKVIVAIGTAKTTKTVKVS